MPIAHERLRCATSSGRHRQLRASLAQDVHGGLVYPAGDALHHRHFALNHVFQAQGHPAYRTYRDCFLVHALLGVRVALHGSHLLSLEHLIGGLHHRPNRLPSSGISPPPVRVASTTRKLKRRWASGSRSLAPTYRKTPAVKPISGSEGGPGVRPASNTPRGAKPASTNSAAHVLDLL